MSAAEREPRYVVVSTSEDVSLRVDSSAFVVRLGGLADDEREILSDSDSFGWYGPEPVAIVERVGVPLGDVLDVVEWFGRNGFASFNVLRGAALAVAGSSASPVSVLDQVRAALAERVRLGLLMLAEITAERFDAAAAADWLDVLGTRPDGLRLILAELVEEVTA